MRRMVFWTGLFDVDVGFSLFFPGFLQILGIATPESVYWTELAGFFQFFLGAVMIISARNLATRGPLVYGAGLLRIAAFLLAGWFGFFGGLGLFLGLVALADLGLGLVFVLGLPGYLNTTHANLLLDRS